MRISGGEWEEIAETVGIVRVPCRLGGPRPYFICPGVANGIACGRRLPTRIVEIAPRRGVRVGDAMRKLREQDAQRITALLEAELERLVEA